MNEHWTNHEDVLVRAVGGGGAIRALALHSTGVARELARVHGALPTAASALCRISGAALLMGGTVKGREQVSIQIKGDGPLGELYAIADAHGAVRVSIHNPDVHLPPRIDGRFAVGAAVGSGTLTVTKSLGMRDPYRGIVQLVSGEIAQDLVHYFQASEQKPSAMGLGEVVDANGVRVAGGFLLQALPGAADETLAEIEERIAAMPPLSTLLGDGESPEQILARLVPEMTVLDRRPVQHTCPCSREKCESILLALGAAEIESIIADQKGTELRCHFCNTEHAFSGHDLSGLLAAARSGVS